MYGVGESTVLGIFKYNDKLMKFTSTSDNCSSLKKIKPRKQPFTKNQSEFCGLSADFVFFL